MTYLVIRFSSVGNVAMSVPVVTSLSRRYPEDTFVVVSKNRLAPLFYGLPNVRFHEAELQNGVKSSVQLFHELRACHIDAVVDLQDTLRSYVLRTLFRIARVPVYVINYGRKEKRHLIMRGYKHSAPLRTEFERYADTFRLAGLESDDSFTAIPVNGGGAFRGEKRRMDRHCAFCQEPLQYAAVPRHQRGDCPLQPSGGYARLSVWRGAD